MKIGIIISLVFGLSQIALSQVTDTLGYASFTDGTPILYQSPNGGFAFGTNGYNDVAKAQSYSHDNAFVLRQVLLEFGEVIFQSEDSASSVRVNVYDNYGFGVTSVGQADSIAPDSVLSFVEIPVYQIAYDGSLTVADFTGSSLVISSRFSVGVDFTNVAIGDTVGLISTTDGDAPDSFDAWELSENGNWFTVEQPSYSWGLEVDFAIFPVIDENDPAGVEDLAQFDFSLFPNPCVDEIRLNTTLDKKYAFSIVDLSGRELSQSLVKRQGNVLNVASLSSGVYLLNITVEESSFSQRFVKL
ncbi:MAG: hypothetical protein ACI9UR_000603 [Bacteroidia bacterium]|jgi:hypothetical protein